MVFCCWIIVSFALIVYGDFVLGPCFVIQNLVSVKFCNHLDGEERAGFFALTVFLTASDLWLFLVVLWVGLRCVIVVFPLHTPLHFSSLWRLSPTYTIQDITKCNIGWYVRKIILHWCSVETGKSQPKTHHSSGKRGLSSFPFKLWAFWLGFSYPTERQLDFF